MDSESGGGGIDWAAARRVLREVFGHDGFRAGQEEVLGIVLAGRNALAVFPTGGGKSLCYQVPALLGEGLTLVISPLIALMKDQVDGLRARGIAAARLDSSLDEEEEAGVREDLRCGRLRLLYVSPERANAAGFLAELGASPISLVAIDEAHCISQWGHHFRPDYLKLAGLLRKWRVPRVLALTATATPVVAREIARQFRIARGDQVRLSHHRPNLDLRVSACGGEERWERLCRLLGESEGPAIVYVTRQEGAEEVATRLQRLGHRARAYHAGLTHEVRSAAQRAFLEGSCRVMVATIAFGMGVDKADVRLVVHYNAPKSLENLSQETGRAGRDGKPARCEWLACAEDFTVLENFIHADSPSEAALGRLVDRLLRVGRQFEVSPHDLSVACDIRPNVVATVVAYLEMDGVLKAEGRHYGVCKVRLLRPMEAVLAGRPAGERRRLAAWLGAGEVVRGWTVCDTGVLAAESGVAREKIFRALLDLEAAGDARVAVAGLRWRFRLGAKVPAVAEVAAGLIERLAAREAEDRQRLEDVRAWAAGRGCLTARLARHFGEKLAGPCGHCDRCRGVGPVRWVRRALKPPGEDIWRRVAALADERHAALGTARQLARFLCGIPSPAARAARLMGHDDFGLLAGRPFEEVLAMAAARLSRD